MFNACEIRPDQKRSPSSRGPSSLRRRLSLQVGSLLLRSATLRVPMNWAYQRLGPKAATGLDLLLEDARIAREFHWRCEFGRRTLSLPVFPELPRSWHTARLWPWGRNRAVRQFYDFYVRHRPEGIFF